MSATAKHSKSALLTRKSAILLWVAGCFWLLGFIFWPVSMGITRAGSLLLIVLLPLGMLALWWPVRWLRWTVLTGIVLVGGFLCWPGRDYNRFVLRAEVANAVARYEGVRYVWGGEGKLGVDCSGLIRRGAVEGIGEYGVRTANPRLVRLALALWWRDLSAKEMASGRVETICKVCDAPSLEALKDKNLHMADFAVTQDGAHVLAYVGDHVWMEADPDANLMKVIRLRLGRDQSAWFHTPVTVLRWRCLELSRR